MNSLLKDGGLVLHGPDHSDLTKSTAFHVVAERLQQDVQLPQATQLDAVVLLGQRVCG